MLRRLLAGRCGVARGRARGDGGRRRRRRMRGNDDEEDEDVLADVMAVAPVRRVADGDSIRS